jgi:hypothetical protein
MKKKRRIEIEIEHREFSMFVSPDTRQVGPQGRAPEASKPDACLTCGADGMLPLADAVRAAGWNAATLRHDIEQGGLHVQRTRSGEWWICKQSLPPDARRNALGKT